MKETMKNVFVILVVWCFAALPSFAQEVSQEVSQAVEPETVTVMDHEVEPRSGLYLVTKDVNVRAGPDTKFKRVAGLKEGERVRAVGKPKGKSWMAVSQDGVTLGFVYSPILTAVVDGALAEEFKGTYMSENGDESVACDYRFRFERKSMVEGDGFSVADYEVRFRCASQQGAAVFYATCS